MYCRRREPRSSRRGGLGRKGRPQLTVVDVMVLPVSKGEAEGPGVGVVQVTVDGFDLFVGWHESGFGGKDLPCSGERSEDGQALVFCECCMVEAGVHQCGSCLRCLVVDLVRDTRKRRDGVAQVLITVCKADSGIGSRCGCCRGDE